MRRIALLIGLLLISNGCNKPAEKYVLANTAAPSARFQESKATGPYAELYRPWDYWFMQHRAAAPTEPGLPAEEGTMSLTGWLDEAGHLLPLLEVERRFEEALKRGEEGRYGSTQVHAIGPLDQTLLDEFEKAKWELKAGYFPPIPGWLAADPPRSAMLIGKDLIVTNGPVGSAKVPPVGEKDGTPVIEQLPWCLYDSAGRELGQTNSMWFNLFSDEWPTLFPEIEKQGWDSKGVGLEPGGYLTFHSTDGRLIARYDYDGTKLSIDKAPIARDHHGFVQVNPRQLAELHAAQQTKGGS